MLSNQAKMFIRMMSNHESTLRRNPVVSVYSTSSDIFSTDEKTKPTETALKLEPDFDSDEDFYFKSFEKEDITDVKEFMRINFYPRNPLCRMLYFTYEDDKEYLHHMLSGKAGNGVSFIARHRNTNKVIATSLSKILTRSEDRSISEAFSNSSNVKLRRCLHILALLKNSVDLFEKYNVDKILEMGSGVSDENYGKRGIVGQLGLRCMERGLDLGCQLITSQATNIISQRHSLQYGLTVEFVLDFESLVIDGQKVLDLTRSPGTTCAMTFSHPI